MFICINGKIVDQKDAHIPACDHGFLYGDGVYETLRTVNGKVWLLNEHLRRLAKSAKAMGIKVPFSNKKIENLIKKLIKKNNLKDYRIRITLSRGCNNFNFIDSKKSTLIIEAKKLKKYPQKIYRDGVSVITYPISRPRPKIKSTSMLPTILAYREAKKKNAFEALLVNEKGNITEASMSNFFAIKNGVIYTPKDEILEGTVRNFLIKILKNKYKIKFQNIPMKNLNKFNEIFITSTIKGVIPVVKIDGKKVKSGKVGSVTTSIIKLFNAAQK